MLASGSGVEALTYESGIGTSFNAESVFGSWFMATDLCAAGLLTPAVNASVRWLCTNLVDPASSHMLVSKIKPCMSQYKLLYGETANGSLKQLQFI